MKKTRLRLMLDYPFFGALALGIKLIKTTSIPTLDINEKRLRYNPDFIETLSKEETLWCYLHVLSHVILGHSFRLKDHDPQLFQLAADYAVNIMLFDSVKLPMPEGCLFDKKYRDWSTEKIYDDLYQQHNEAMQLQQNLSDNDSDNSSSALTEEQQEKLTDYQKKIATAERHGLVSKAESDSEIESIAKINIAGKINPGQLAGSSIERIISKSTQVTIRWEDLLLKFMNKTCMSYYDWMIPNRRYSFGDVLMPSIKKEKELSIAIAIDVSGSIDHNLLNKFMSEFKSLIASINYTELIVLSCHTKVENLKIYQKGDKIDYAPHGTGGTYFYPVWSAIRETGKNPVCLVYFTDLECHKPHFGDDPGYPVLFIGKFDQWVKNNLSKLPFGEKIEMKY